MNTLILRCLFFCALVGTQTFSMEANTGLNQIIIVQYDQLTTSSVKDLATHVSDIYEDTEATPRVKITEYLKEEGASSLTEEVILRLIENGIDEDHITVTRSSSPTETAYFSIVVSSERSIQ